MLAPSTVNKATHPAFKTLGELPNCICLNPLNSVLRFKSDSSFKTLLPTQSDPQPFSSLHNFFWNRCFQHTRMHSRNEKEVNTPSSQLPLCLLSKTATRLG